MRLTRCLWGKNIRSRHPLHQSLCASEMLVRAETLRGVPFLLLDGHAKGYGVEAPAPNMKCEHYELHTTYHALHTTHQALQTKH